MLQGNIHATGKHTCYYIHTCYRETYMLLHTCYRETYMLQGSVGCLLNFMYPPKELPKVMSQLAELREFYDPDTVQLMNWIM